MNNSISTSNDSVSKQNKYKHNFSLYKAPIKNVNPFKTITLDEVYSLIISDKYTPVTTDLRSKIEKSQQGEIKASELDYVTFSGTFSKRNSKGLIIHSNLFCIDLDDVQNILEVKEKIIELLKPSLLFISPSGNGLKIVYKIKVSEKIKHLDYYSAFEQFFKQELDVVIDNKCKDIPRACFLCSDKEAYFNEDAEVLDNSFIDTFQSQQHKIQQIETITDFDTIIERCKVWLSKKESFVIGNRNNFITRLSGAYNRYGIPQHVAECDLLTFVQSDFKEAEIKATVKSIYNNTDYHNTASFELNKPYEFEVKKNVKKETEPTPLLPIDGLPEYIQSFINEYTSVYNTPRDYIAASVIFSTAFAIGNKLELIGKYDNIPLLWLAIVGNVSSGKTDPLKTCLKHFQQKDSLSHKEYLTKLALFKAYEKLGKKEKDNTDTVKEPSYFQYILNDYTPESLFNAHTINNRGLCIYRDELKGWLDDFGRYSKSGEQSTMLSTFYRQPMQINRASNEPINIPAPSIYVAGGIQPDILNDLAKDSRAENGFLARLMFAYPDLQKKQYYNNKKLDSKTLDDYHSYLDTLSSIPNLVKLYLNDEAETVYSHWFDKNTDITNKEPKGYLKGVYGKLDVISLRLAIVIHGMKWACNNNTETEITAQSMQTAIELTEYFRLTALKVYDKIFNANNNNLKNKEIAKYCNSLGASQTQIGKALNISQQAVSKLLK